MPDAESPVDPTSPATPMVLPEIRVPLAWTFAGLVGGLIVGIVGAGSPAVATLRAVAEPVGALWLRGLGMTILPLVVALLVVGIVQMGVAARAGPAAARALAWIAAIYVGSALIGALAMPTLLDMWPVPGAAAGALHVSVVGAPPPVPGISDFLLSVLPNNILAAASADMMLPSVAFFSLFAIAITRLAPAPRQQLLLLFEGVAGAMIVIIGWVLRLAPVGVFALSLGLAAHAGAAAVGVLAHYVLTVSATGWLVLLAAPLLAGLVARVRLRDYIRAMAPPGVVALATQSSLASLPAMLAATQRLGLRQTSADFVLPLCVAVFRATGPAMNMAVAIYVARLTGTPVGPAAMAAGVVVAAITEVSSPSLPGAISFISAVAPVALAMGVPIAPLALFVAIDMLPDLTRTVGNVAMDVAVVALVDRGADRGVSAPEAGPDVAPDPRPTHH